MSDGLAQLFLVWIFPPLVGAVIGFLTNDIAIRMLFRPLREVRVFGIRLPFTPGIIPRQRGALAESIGNMVSKNLITPDAVRSHLGRGEFREAFGREVARFTNRLLNQQLSFLSRERIGTFFALIGDFFSSSLARLLASERFIETVNSLVSDFFGSIAKNDVATIIDREFLKTFVTKSALPFLAGDRTKQWLSGELDRWIDGRLRENRPLSEIVPGSVIEDIFASFTRFIPELVSLLFDWLESPEVRKEIETQGRILVKNITGKLNSVQQLVVSIAQYDKTLNEKMPEIVTDSLASLRTAASNIRNQAHFVDQAKRGITGWIGRGAGDIVKNRGTSVRNAVHAIVDRLFGLLSGPGIEEFVASNIDELFVSGKAETLGEFVERITGLDTQSLTHAVVPHIGSVLRAPGTAAAVAKTIATALTALLSRLETMTLAEILPANDETKTVVDAFITEHALELLGTNLPAIVESLQVKKLVVDKINSLDVLDVEKLLLMVIAKHLKWINIIGAVLGAIIGFSQVVIRMLF